MRPEILTMLSLSALACASVVGTLRPPWIPLLNEFFTDILCMPDPQLIGNGTRIEVASCYWDGTSPFCAGGCSDGYEDCGTSSCGDGACCVTGYKKYCCRGGCPDRKDMEIALERSSGEDPKDAAGSNKSSKHKVPTIPSFLRRH
ncbi:hypothetical protein F4680DRAFT_426912 [Xylaria scruposa]|nr:hypothetical protein F4680DRAFT_426912 [Xylaria scruposa]